jgi:hypothetical protein
MHPLAKEGCPSEPLLLQMYNQRNRETPGTFSVTPANGEPPEQGTYAQYLLVLRMLSFNKVGHKPYCKPEPIDLHRFLTPC